MWRAGAVGLVLAVAAAAAHAGPVDVTSSRGPGQAGVAIRLLADVPAAIRRGEPVTILLHVTRDGRPGDGLATCMAARPLFIDLEDALDPTPAGGMDLGTGAALDGQPACDMAIAGTPHGPGSYEFTWEPDTSGRVNLIFAAAGRTLTVPADVASAAPSRPFLGVFVLFVSATLATGLAVRRRRASKKRSTMPGGVEMAVGTPTGSRTARAVAALLRHPLYPSAFQWVLAVAFLAIVASTLFGPNNSGQNAGMAVTWTIWWPLLPLSFLLAGRSWCAICPLAWLGDVVQRIAGARLPVPVVLRRGGPWIIAALFVLVTYVDETWRLAADTRRTSYLLLTLIALAVFFSSFFERRSFCRYACFVGGFAGNYSRAGLVALRVDRGRCRDCRSQDCYRGNATTPGCPVFLAAAGVEEEATCHLCGHCLKDCRRDAIEVSVRAPASGLWTNGSSRPSDAVLAALVAGIVLLEQVVLLRAWIPLVEDTGRLLGVDPYIWYPLVYGLLLAAFIAAPLAGLAIAAAASRALAGAREPGGWLRNAATFGSGLVPLALAGHLAHTSYHLLTRSRAVPAALLALAGRFPAAVQAAWLSPAAVLRIEMAVLVAGAGASVYVAYRLARRYAPGAPFAAWLPHAVLIAVLLGAKLYVVLTMISERG